MRAARAARTATCALDVEVRWGDGELLVSEHLRGVSRYVLFADTVPAHESGFVVQRDWLDGESLCLASLRDDTLTVTHATGAQQALRLGEQTMVHVGPLVFRVAVVEPRARTAASTWREALKPENQAWTAASLAVHALALVCMTLMPPRAQSLSLDLMSEDMRYAAYLNTPIASEDPLFHDELAPRPEQPAEQEGARARGDEGAAGKPDAPQTKRRLAVQGEDDERAPAKQTSASEARVAGILGALARTSDQFDPSSAFGPDTPLGYDPVSAIGALFGPAVGDSFGFDGLGIKGTGHSGGGTAEGTVGIGMLDTGTGARNTPGAQALGGLRRESHVPTLRSGPVEIRGALSKESIRRAIHARLNEVRFCYEQGLIGDPQLEGRVAVTFLIAPTGAVQTAALNESTLPSQRVAQCVLAAVRRFSFPTPDGGGYVTVTYPFNFAAH